MMYLKADGIASIAADYQTTMVAAIKTAYLSVRGSVPVSFYSLPLFDATGDLNEDFLRMLLTAPFPTLSTTYPWVQDYLDIGRMLHSYTRERTGWSKLVTSQPLGKNTFYAAMRRDYLERYHIAHLLTTYPISSSTINPFIGSDDKINGLLRQYRHIYNGWNKVISLFIEYSMLDKDLLAKIKTAANLEVCPYCNRQYITSFYSSGTKYIPADLDHFYPQSLFPLFSLSLYNLIPSCLVCNRFLKGDSFQDIWHPYQDGFNDNVHFAVDNPKSVTSLIGDNTAFTLSLQNTSPPNTDEHTLIDNTIAFFKLEDIYQIHKQYVRELLYKKHAYNDSYLRQLQDIFRTSGISVSEANLILYGHEIDATKIHERPLGKLSYDIINM